jgi:CheY-like chemotaxis protein
LPALTEFAEHPPQAESAPRAETSHIPVPNIEIPQIDIPSDTNYALTESAEAPQDTPSEPALEPQTFDAPPPAFEMPVAAQDLEVHEDPQVDREEAHREFERRALPIEDESAVLGNNWRDAVIAKAVGAGGAAPSDAGEPEHDAQAEAPSSAEPGGQIRILLAEDNAINALLTRTLLEAEGHSVDTVEDGVLAVEAMKTASYDLIFMDMRMPNMDGLEATRKIRALSNVGRSLPIIALTANAFDDDRNACFDSGMNDFMTKPVSAEELSEKVRDWTSPEAKERLAKAA